MFSFLYKERRWAYDFLAKKTAVWETFSRQKRGVQIECDLWNGPFAVPFARDGHMIQKSPCWMAKGAVGPWKERIWAFWMRLSLCFCCPFASFAIQQGVFLYHVTVSCKEPIGYKESGKENVTIQLVCQISYSLCSMSVHIFFQGSIPFAVIGSNTITDVRGKQVRVRQYPWGMAEGLLI